jgi:poly-gamma-glutamate synthesis protein (capsule biosynthesis protein)
MKPAIDIVSLANNHAYDVGRTGQEETVRRLTDMNIPYFGSYFSPSPVWRGDIGGVPLAIIGYHQFQPAVEEMEQLIAEEKAAGRVVIVMPHWGNEYIMAPQENQRALARRMAAAGADIILGGHPHVPQGIEIIDGVPVFYSLGNFVFDQRIPETWEGLTVSVQIFPDYFRFHLLPVVTKGSQPVPMEERQSADLLRRLSAVSSEDIQDVVQQGIILVRRREVQ